MFSRRHKILKFSQLFIDLFLLNLAYAIAGVLRFEDLKFANEEYYNYYLQLLIFLNLSWVLLGIIGDIYSIKPSTEIRVSIWRFFRSMIVQFLILALMLVVLKKFVYSRLFFGYFFLFFTTFGVVARTLFFVWLRRYLGKEKNARKVILVGDTPQANRFLEMVENHPEYGIRVQHHLKAENSFENLETQGAEEVYLAISPQSVYLQKWHQFAEKNMLLFRMLPEFGFLNPTNIRFDNLGGIPVLYPSKEPLEYVHNRLLKRLADIVVSSFVLLFIFPWFLPISAILIKLSSPGPVFFRQERSGLRDGAFTCWKLRTMVINEASDSLQSYKGDPRITKVGKFLRRHNLDEMPQFFNVFVGQMSVVGPRPHMLQHTEEYRKLIDQFMVRHLIKPGLTGLAQSRGLRGETSNPEQMINRVKADVYYLENWSLMLDLKILLVTFFNMITGRIQGS